MSNVVYLTVWPEHVDVLVSDDERLVTAFTLLEPGDAADALAELAVALGAQVRVKDNRGNDNQSTPDELTDSKG